MSLIVSIIVLSQHLAQSIGMVEMSIMKMWKSYNLTSIMSAIISHSRFEIIVLARKFSSRNISAIKIFSIIFMVKYKVVV